MKIELVIEKLIHIQIYLPNIISTTKIKLFNISLTKMNNIKISHKTD